MDQLEKEKLSGILQVNEELHRIKDIDMVLERILLEARHFTRADAGSIYLVEKDRLRISYIQNDSLFLTDRANPLFYMNHTVDINPYSMAGYVALTKKPLLIKDAYAQKDDVPYRLNRSFDEASHYQTRSMLTIPMIANNERLIGVMQIINAMDEKGNITTFTRQDQMFVSIFANYATAAIERAQMTREIILRMVRMAELRDPEETGAHVKRVASYAVEIFKKWAAAKAMENREIKRASDLLKIAAMLHDVGKVAISDMLLKKHGTLAPEEFEQMKWHTVYGARLFVDSTSDWDDMAKEIALNHHEKWDGSGYPGPIADLYSLPSVLAKGKSGQEIPLPARIVAIADVYDALASQRSYKCCWEEDRILSFFQEQKNRHFDPEVVEAFFSVHDVIRRVREKYREP